MKKQKLLKHNYPSLLHNSLIYRLLTLSALAIVFFVLPIVFHSCEKDDHLDSKDLDDKIESRENSRETSEEISNFFNAFYDLKNIEQSEDNCFLNPYYYDIQLESGFIASYFGPQAVIFNVIESPFKYSKWDRNQILIKKNEFGRYDVSNLIYLADSSFYSGKNFNPLLVNFTGNVVEIDTELNIQRAYLFNLGDIINVLTEFNIPYLDVSDELTYRTKRIPCPSGAGKSHFWRNLGRWFRGLFDDGSSSGSSSSGSSGIGGFGRGSYGGSGGVNNGNSGSGSGGIDTGSYNLCENPTEFWA